MNAPASEVFRIKRKEQSYYPTLLRAGISILLLLVLFYKSDTGRYVELIMNSSPLFLLLAFLVTVLSIVISAYKWRLLVVAQGHSVPLRILISSYFVGLFFNNFLPTSIGGDAYRIYDLRKVIGDGPAATASVVAERILAAFTLGLIVLVGAVLDFDRLAGLKLTVLIFVLTCFLLSLFVFYGHKLGLLLRGFEGLPARKIKETLDSMRASVQNKPGTIMVLVLSFIFQAMVVLINVLIIEALGLNVPVSLVFLFIPIILALTMLPVSMNGLGVREMAYAYFFTRVGVSTEEAVTVSICFFLIVTLVSLMGGIIFVFRK